MRSQWLGVRGLIDPMTNLSNNRDVLSRLLLWVTLAIAAIALLAQLFTIAITLRAQSNQYSGFSDAHSQDVLRLSSALVEDVASLIPPIDWPSVVQRHGFTHIELLSILSSDNTFVYQAPEIPAKTVKPSGFSRWVNQPDAIVRHDIALNNGDTVTVTFRPNPDAYYATLWQSVKYQLLFLAISFLALLSLGWLAWQRLVRPQRRCQNQLTATFDALYRSAPLGIVQISDNNSITYVNQAMQQYAGFSGESVQLTEIVEMVHPDDREKIQDSWREYLKNRTAFDLAYRHRDMNGQYRWVKCSVVRVGEDSDTEGNHLVFISDISDQVELKNYSQRSSSFYQTLSEINSAILNSSDREALFSVVSQIFVQVGGFCVSAFAHDDGDGGTLRSLLIHAIDEGNLEVEELSGAVNKEDNWLGQISAAAITTNEIQVCNDCQDLTEVALSGHTTQFYSDVRSLISVPINCRGNTLAALVVASCDPNFFSLDIQDYVAKIGANISHALDNFAREHELQVALASAEQSEQRLATTLRSIGDAVLVTDKDGQVTLMNPAAEQLTGWSEEDAKGCNANRVLQLVQPDGALSDVSIIDEIIQQGSVVHSQCSDFLVDKSGQQLPVAKSGSPIRYSNTASVDGAVVVLRDQSEGYHAQAALRREETRYAALFETLPVGIFVFHAENKQFFINSELRRILRIKKSNVTIYDVEDLVHPADVFALRRYFEIAKNKGETVITDYYRYRCYDNSIIWAKMRLTPTVDEAGNVVSMVGGVLDVTAEREHFDQIQTLSTMYATLSRVNYLVVTAQSEVALLQDISETISQVPGFDQVTVYRLGRTDSDKHLTSGAIAMDPPDFEENLVLDMETMLRRSFLDFEQKSIVVNDCLSDTRLEEEVRDFCLRSDINAALALPVTKSGVLYGSILILSQQPDIFNSDVQELVEEISDVTSFALTKLANDEQKRQAEIELTRNEERLRLGLSVTKTGMFEINFRTDKVILDEVSRHLYGIQSAIGQCTIAQFYRKLPQPLKDIIEQATDELAGQGDHSDTFSIDERMRDDSGSYRWLRIYGAITAERTESGSPVRLLGFISDITDLKGQEDREYLAATVFAKSNESILILDENREILMANQAFIETYGYDVDEIMGETLEIFRSSRHSKDFYREIRDSLEQTGSWQGEWWRTYKGGEEHPALAVISAVKDSTGTITHHVLQEMDISDQKEAERRISNLAYHDSLTNLPNRSLLRDRVEQAIAVAEREDVSLALLFLDLDHFKNINDSLGHAVGDLLLQEVANRLLKSVRRSDTVGRLGGDEFMMLLPEANADDAAHVAQKALEECIQPYVLNNHNLAVTPSIGIAMFPRDGTDYDELLKKADTAMYRAKDEGRNGYRFFTPEMNQAVFQRMIMESSLRKAVDNQEFELHYQPKYNIDGKTLVGVEALLRWHQPSMGMVSPAQFIPVAEESGLIVEIGHWVLVEACRQIKVWQDSGLGQVKVSINFSTRQFSSRSIEESVFAVLEAEGLSGDCLEIEITESLLAQDMDYTLKSLNALKKYGIDISVDDFGTGYSSLSYLKRFPIDRLKIDQSFVRDLDRDADDRAIAEAVITMGHSLGIQVIAEGVENERQLAILSEMQCDEVQGYYLGRPMDVVEMTNTIRRALGAESDGRVAS